ncbi:MAG TPA: GH25 family lysozyme [Bryobacteraceae bacterium]|nr:GH25 family lysozyme [Bryobacteraceae bacterium]
MIAGIDVSHFQGVVDWPRAAASGIQFCFMKATEGAGNVDPRFIQNWKNSRNAGLVRGAYHFFHPAAPASAQANSFLRMVARLEPGDLPPVLDLEVPAAWVGITSQDRAPLAIEWLDTVEKTLGVMPIVYLSPAFATEILANAPGLARFPVWFAHYTTADAPTVVKPWSTWNFWQYSRDGKIPGVALPVDLDRFNGSLDDLRALTAKPSA